MVAMVALFLLPAEKFVVSKILTMVAMYHSLEGNLPVEQVEM